MWIFYGSHVKNIFTFQAQSTLTLAMQPDVETQHSFASVATFTCRKSSVYIQSYRAFQKTLDKYREQWI